MRSTASLSMAVTRLVCEQDLEGVVARRKDPVYGDGWFKIQNPAYSQYEGRRASGNSDRIRMKNLDSAHVGQVKVQQRDIRSGNTVCFDALPIRGNGRYLRYTLFTGDNRSDGRTVRSTGHQSADLAGCE